MFPLHNLLLLHQAAPMDLSAVEALRLERQIIVADCQVGGDTGDRAC